MPLIQSVGLVLLLSAMAFAGWPLGACLPLALLLIWLPRLRMRQAQALVVQSGGDALAQLTRDLSHTTSHNALSAAGVAFSVKQLAGKVQSQLSAAAQIVASAERVINTEQTTSHLSQQALGSRSGCSSSAEGHTVLAESIGRMHRLSQQANASRETDRGPEPAQRGNPAGNPGDPGDRQPDQPAGP